MQVNRIFGRVVSCSLAIVLAGTNAVFAAPTNAPEALRPARGADTFRTAGDARTRYQIRHVMAASACESLAGRNFGDRTVIGSATAVAASAPLPAYCDVIGTIEGTIAFELALPMGWNGRLLVTGNGGFAGEALSVYAGERSAALLNGFAYAHSNTGHYGNPVNPYFDASWAFDNPKAVIDWGNRSVHVLTMSAKEVITNFYQHAPERSYYDGCSTGGQQAYTEAEKYPNDFDGIVGGDPNLGGADTYVGGAYEVQQYDAAPFSAAQIQAVAGRTMSRCDALDGLRDHLIGDPRRCKFDPKVDGAGLTPAQLRAYEALLGGAQNKYGQLEFGAALGAEYDNGFVGIIIPSAPGAPTAAEAYVGEFLQFIAPFPVSGTFFSIRTFNINVDPYRLSRIAGLMNAENPDLSAFARHGGRFLGYHGWADPLITPYFSVAYAESVFATFGVERARSFYRLFMVLGMGHCQGTGYGLNEFDELTPLIDWVEAGIAPEDIVATRYESTTPVYKRKLCAYPDEAKYAGGNPRIATSFVCARGLRGVPFPPRGKPIPQYPFRP